MKYSALVAENSKLKKEIDSSSSPTSLALGHTNSTNSESNFRNILQ